MRVRLFLLSTCVALLGSGIFTPSSADAGYLFASDPADVRLQKCCAATAMSAAQSDHERDKAESLDRLIRLLFRKGVNEAPAGEMDGTHTSSSTASGGAGPAALPASLLAPPLSLTQRLRPDQHLWIPPPFLSGVFRPPRFAA
jgi:hypothetical protein